MENKQDTIIKIFGTVTIIVLLTIIAINKPYSVAPPPIDSCKEDSLQKVITDLQIEIETEEDGWDNKEKRYEDILFEYEYGLDHLKHYHLDAYKDFHRIISHKENYTHVEERENKKRLQATKW